MNAGLYFFLRTQALANPLKHPISNILEGYCTYIVLFSSRMQSKMAENRSAEASLWGRSTLFNTAISQSKCAMNCDVILGEYVRCEP